MTRAEGVAFAARRLAFLASRPEILYAGFGAEGVLGAWSERFERLDEYPIPLDELDRLAMLTSTEVDRLCAEAVVALSKPGPKKVLLDVFALLGPDRLAAIFYAVPKNRRGTLRRNPYVGHAVQQVEDEMPAALRWLETGYESEDLFGRVEIEP